MKIITTTAVQLAVNNHVTFLSSSKKYSN